MNNMPFDAASYTERAGAWCLPQRCTTKGGAMLRLKPLMVLMASVVLMGCKEHKPDPPCVQTVPITERHGHRVYQTLSGVYIKADEIGIRECSSKPYSEDPWQRKYVESTQLNYYWGKERLMTYAELRAAGLPPGRTPVIELYIRFEQDYKHNPLPAWWYTPAIPHERYPIDLLPNFRLDQPDPNAGVGPVLSKVDAYWAVRGTQRPDTGKPYSTFCAIRAPLNNAPKDIAYQRDPKWLVQGETYSQELIGNTCRGGVSATNGKLGAMIDVPGAALPDIDKIYQAVSLKLTELTVE